MTGSFVVAPPPGTRRLLLHACCAPCCGGIILRLREQGLDPTVYFCNPNIQPVEEYERRKEMLRAFCDRQGVAWVEGERDVEAWQTRCGHLADEPERGARCAACIALRLEAAAATALRLGLTVFASSLAASRRKSAAQVAAAGREAAARHPGLVFWAADWRKRGGMARTAQVVVDEGFVVQDYCGCVASLRKARPGD